MAGIAAQSVVKLCMDRKSTDNITVIMVCFSSLGLESSLSDYASVWIETLYFYIFNLFFKLKLIFYFYCLGCWLNF